MMQRKRLLSLLGAVAMICGVSGAGGVHVASAGSAGFGCGVAGSNNFFAREAAYNQLRQGCPRAGQQLGPLLATAQQERSKLALANIGGSWAPLGPAPIDNSGVDPAPAWRASGRIEALAYDAPLNTIFAGAADGGVWHITKNGSSWSNGTFDQLPNLAIDALAVDPTDASGNTIFAASGEAQNCGDCLNGSGLYKTTNGGTSWTQVASNLGTVSSVAVDPTTVGNHYVYAGGYCAGVAVSSDGGNTFSVPNNSLKNSCISDLAVDASGNIWAAVGYPAGSGTNGVWLSIDHGQTWTAENGTAGSIIPGTNGGHYRLALAPTTAPAVPALETLYVIVGDKASFSQALNGVYRTTNGGTTWTQIVQSSDVPSYEKQEFYDIYIAVDPFHTNTVYFGLSDIYRIDHADGSGPGPALTNLTNVYGGGSYFEAPVHPDQHAVTFLDANTVWFGSDGGVFQDSSGNFSDINHNLNISQFYAGSLGTTKGVNNQMGAGFIIGGLQDNGAVKNQGSGLGGLAWLGIFGGDGGQTLIDPTDNTTIYEEYTNANVSKSTDTGATWNTIHCGSNSCPSPNSNFIAPLAMDPGNSQVLYSGGSPNGIFVQWSTDGGSTWNDLGSAFPQTPSAIAVSDNPQRTVYVGDNGGDVFVTKNDGTNWTQIATGGSCGTTNPGCSGQMITSLAVDPKNAATVYATVTGFNNAQKNHVFKSTNSGSTWTDISTALPDEPYQSIAISPTGSNVLFLGGDPGMFSSRDGGATWQNLGTGLPNAQVYNVQISDTGTTVVAFTHGRGAWQLQTAPTAATVARFSATRAGRTVTFTWRAARTGDTAGFNLYAAGRRLNAHLIPVHAAPQYRYTTHYTGAAHYRLTAVLRTGQSITVARG